MSRKRYPEEFMIGAVKQVTDACDSAYDVVEQPQLCLIVGSGGISGSDQERRWKLKPPLM